MLKFSNEFLKLLYIRAGGICDLVVKCCECHHRNVEILRDAIELFMHLYVV